jgi:demethylmenaquinone methyltransferase / 2-methoxy-6-polyprenyl-1,4-benzoquinol methylase
MPVDKSESRVRKMFGEIAPRYELMNHLLSLGIDQYWRWQTVRLVPPRGDAPLLDLCTGTGALVRAYRRRMPEGTRIMGADFCHEMLIIGRAKSIGSQPDGRVAFVESDALRLPLADEQFQIVSIAFGLRNMADADQGLREMVRVCQTGGRVAVLDFSLPQRQPMRGMYLWFFRHVVPKVGQAVTRSPSGAYNYLPASVMEFPEGEALCARMRAAGLQELRFWPMTFGTVTLYVGTKR